MTDHELHANQPRKRIQKTWRWLFMLGILFIILGSIGLGMSIGLTFVSMLFLGLLLLLAGLSQGIHAFTSSHWKETAWHIIIALLYLTGGGLIIYDPFLASTIITALLASVLILMGIIRLLIAFSFQHEKGWGWFLLSGLSALILGILILIQWPWSGLWVIGLFIAIELIISGWTYLFLALSLRRI